MEFVVITSSGERVSLAEFAGAMVYQVSEGQPGALATVKHARDGRDAAEQPVVAEMLDAVVANPQRIREVLNTASDVACSNFTIAMALAYAERNPGARVEMVPEGAEDGSFIASFQPAPKGSQ